MVNHSPEFIGKHLDLLAARRDVSGFSIGLTTPILRELSAEICDVCLKIDYIYESAFCLGDVRSLPRRIYLSR